MLYLILFFGFTATLLFQHFSDDEIQQGKTDNDNNAILYIFSILEDGVVETVFRNNRVKIPAQGGKYAVPCSGTNRGVK